MPPAQHPCAIASATPLPTTHSCITTALTGPARKCTTDPTATAWSTTSRTAA